MKISPPILWVFVTVFVICAGCGSGPVPRQHHEMDGGFSYEPPAGWQVVEFPGLKYRISHGHRENDFAPNINVIDEAFEGTLGAYVDSNLQSMKMLFVKMRILRREEFVTHDSEPAVRILAENEQQGRMLRQTFFFVGSGNRKYVVTCAALGDAETSMTRPFLRALRHSEFIEGP